MTDTSGNYTITSVANGSHTVSPAKSGYVFSPSSTSVTVNGANQTGKNFAAIAGTATYTLSGAVTSGVVGLAGVMMTLSGAGSGTATTDSSGNYTLAGVANGSYTLTPSKSGYSFSPSSKTLSVNGANQSGLNFYLTQPPVTYTMSGTIHSGSNAGPGLSGAMVSIAGLTANTSSTGAFFISGIPAGTYTFSVSKSGYDTYSSPGYNVVSSQSGLTFYLVPTASPSSGAIYEALVPPASSAADFVIQANAEGAKGYCYVTDESFANSPGRISVYMKYTSQNSNFSYKALTPASSAANFMTQANTEGAAGYRYFNTEGSPPDLASVFVKDNSLSSTFSYEALTPATSITDFIAQANSEGAKGYRYMANESYASSAMATVYVRDNSQGSTFSYKALTPANTTADFITQANSEGAKGYKYMANESFSLSTMMTVYVKDNSQTSTFSYQGLAEATSADSFITQANTEGANGYRYMSSQSGNIALYIDYSHCQGPLCLGRPGHPLY